MQHLYSGQTAEEHRISALWIGRTVYIRAASLKALHDMWRPSCSRQRIPRTSAFGNYATAIRNPRDYCRLEPNWQGPASQDHSVLNCVPVIGLSSGLRNRGVYVGSDQSRGYSREMIFAASASSNRASFRVSNLGTLVCARLAFRVVSGRICHFKNLGRQSCPSTAIAAT